MGMAPPASQGGRIGGITYNGGPVMTGWVNVYVIWYGTFPSWSSTQTLVDYFIAHWGASHSYGVLRSYTGSNGRVAPELALAGESLDSGSRGTRLGDSDIQALVSTAITNGTFPSDTNGIYLVFIGQGVTVTSGLCADGGYCGYHDHETVNSADIKFGIVGSGNCTGGCGVPHLPNGNAYAEAMINTIAHEIAETVTDPDINAWGAGASLDEVGDKCNFNFSEQHNAPNGVPATAQVGDNYYFIQKLWTPTNGGGCYSGYSPPAAIVWQEGSGGQIGAWKMTDPNTVSSYLYYNTYPQGQTVVAVGDLFNDVNPDILSIDPSMTGPLMATELYPNGLTGFATLFDYADLVDWKIVAVADVNGDGFGDILWTNPSSGDTWLYLMQGSTTLNMQHLGAFLPWLPQGAADFDGNGTADILWVDNADNIYSIWQSLATGGTGDVPFNFPPAVDLGVPIVGAGDFNGNSRADVLKLRTSDNAMFVDLPIFSQANPSFYTSEYWLGVLPTYPNQVPYAPPFAGLVDPNRDGTSDFYVQMPGGLQIFTLGNWKTGDFAGFTIISNSQVFGDGDWTVVGTGGFSEN
jgi:hypothetical protein